MSTIIGINKPYPERQKLAINHMTDLFTLDGGLPPPDMRNEDGTMKPLPPAPPPPPVRAALIIDNNKLLPSETTCLYGGTADEKMADSLRVVCYEGIGGVRVKGGCYEITDACISLNAGEAEGMGSVGVSVCDHGRLTVKDSFIYSNGQSTGAVSADSYGILRVYDSTLISQGSPFGSNAPEGRTVRKTPPAPLEMLGNCRTHLSTDHSCAYFYNSTIITDGWAALSTDTSHGYVYLEANDCVIKAVKSGYGVYSDKFCHVLLNHCSIDAASHGLIIDGEADARFNGCNINCGDYFAMIHCAGGPPSQVGTVTTKGGDIICGKEAFTIRSQNTIIDMEDTKLICNSGVLIHSKVNDDPMAPDPAGRTLFGIRATFRKMDLAGDIIHDDLHRDMTITLEGTTLCGMMSNTYLSMDNGSRWVATADSTVTLRDRTIDTAQIDATDGVTVICNCAEDGRFQLPSGGVLIAQKL